MSACLYITDREVIKKVKKEQQRRQDKKPTQTATKLLLEYFSLMQSGSLKSDRPADAAA